ncbi:prepilin-type N-terminal cleavage/methylation domain-containing protein [Bacillus sp. AGMB 02131]|uniref:Prepilin-type N-terminal cleavage/methylation domain-containing protein n=1 Tax=Peribacillus faecalis TaxID=2772559 RepID=A0A927CUM2_9BACI|nr:competence type IV pilus minor pilin ComGF [Peribacillus faecalis]MBD3108122.1 prepilin-type N-terminal cleavage/methylation domain-containing protein [Peribacillus faecalis]
MKTVRGNKWNFVMLLKRESGFTLIEMLFSLTIMLIVAHLFLQTMLVVQPLKAGADEMNPLEWELFMHSLKKEIRMADTASAKGDKLDYIKEGTQYTVSRYNNILRRQAFGTGHVILLHNVKSFKVERQGDFIKLTVADLSGKQYIANLLCDYE